MSDAGTSKYEGWAVVEMFGHTREVGYVTTEYFGPTALLRIEVPPLLEREVTLLRPEWIDGELAGAGSKIARSAVPGRTRFVGPGAIYALNPCTQDAAFSALEAITQREVKVIELVKRAQLATTFPGEEDEELEDSGMEDEEETIP